MKVERNRAGNKYTFTPEDKKDENFLDRIAQLEEENKTLKDNVEFLHSCLDDRDKSIAIMQEENKKLKEKISSLRIELVQEKGRTGKKWTPLTPYI